MTDSCDSADELADVQEHDFDDESGKSAIRRPCDSINLVSGVIRSSGPINEAISESSRKNR